MKIQPTLQQRKSIWIALCFSFFFSVGVSAQPFLQTLVTNGLAEPYGVAVVGTNYFVTDSANNRVVKFDPGSAVLSVVAGSPTGAPGSTNGIDGTKGVFARFYSPQGIVFSERRNALIVADSGNHNIRVVSAIGDVSDLAGSPAGAPAISGNLDGRGASARFNGPSALAVDWLGKILVADLVNNRIRQIDPITGDVTTLPGTFNRPNGLAVDKNSRDIYVADSGTHSILVIHEGSTTPVVVAGSFSQFDSGEIDSVVGGEARFRSPSGLLWVGGTTGLLVSDTGNHVIRQVSNNSLGGAFPNNFSVSHYGSFDIGSFDKPISLAVDGVGNFPLVDLGKNALFLLQTTIPQPPVKAPQIGVVNLTTNIFNDIVTELAPVVSAEFHNDVKVGILAEDGTTTTYTIDPDPTRLPAPPYKDGGTIDDFNNLTSIVIPGLKTPQLFPVGPNALVTARSTQQGRRDSTNVTARFRFTIPEIKINGNNLLTFTVDTETKGAELHFTTGLSTNLPDPTPTPDTLFIPGKDNARLLNGTNDIYLRLIAFRPGYVPSPPAERLFRFADIEKAEIGVSHEIKAGIGSTVIVPVEVKVPTGQTLQSLQFRVEVEPNSLATPKITTQFRNLQIGTNDFIRLAVPTTNAPFVLSYTTNNNTTAGLAISFVGGNTGLNLSGSSTLTLLAVPIPPTATNTDSYTIRIVNPSGTSDGSQTPLFMTALPPVTLTIENISYLVGDSAVANWYNAGDFGSKTADLPGRLNNNDVNNAFHGSLGLFTPFAFSDVFDAMDAFPEDSAGSVGGDGQIRFLDWQVILLRSLGLKTNNWTRSWAIKGVRSAVSVTANVTGEADSPATEISSGAASDGWVRQAKITAQTVDQIKPGAQVSVPVSVTVSDGSSVSGLQFRAVITPNNGAPALSVPAEFVPDSTLPAPITMNGSQDGLPINETVGAWSLVQNPFTPALQRNHALGQIRFTVPASAQAGQSYTVSFANVDGSPDLQTQYDFESIPATVWVGTPAQVADEVISDEWKAHFFGNKNNALARSDADPDDDGVSNADEYVHGNNPAKLRLHRPSVDWRNELAQGRFHVQWFGQAGKQYVVESSADLQTWSTVASDVAGSGNIQEVTDSQAGSAPHFYRVRRQ